MRYGIQHNVHKKNEKSDFTRQPKDMNEFLGNPLKTQSSGTHAPLLEEGYSYQGGEGMRAVGEVGVSQRYGGGRDGTHHKMERRMVYEEVPEAPEMGEPTQPPLQKSPSLPLKKPSNPRTTSRPKLSTTSTLKTATLGMPPVPRTPMSPPLPGLSLPGVR